MDIKKIITRYVQYNLWANKKIADVLLKIDSALLDKELKSSFPSIRKTVHHIWDAELAWMMRLKGESVNWPPSAEFKNPAIDSFVTTSKTFVDYLTSKEENYFDFSTMYKTIKGETYTNTNAGIIMHCVNHGSYHRGQIITMLRELGITDLPATDFIAYQRLF
ncbi:MAG: DNA polymerase [Bacteroidia bacterium]|nr:DNA polymerase [Bacteroidia bacterium]